MSNYEQIAKQAETDNARRQDAGVNSLVENQFEAAQVEFGDEPSTNRGYNKRIPPSEGGVLDDRGRQARGGKYEGDGGPVDKLNEPYQQQGDQNDNDVVGSRVSSGLGSAKDIASQGQEATRANVGRNPPGPGGPQFKGGDY